MLETYTDVVPLVHNPQGWTKDQIWIVHDSDPVFRRDLQDSLEEASNWTLHNRTAEFTDGRLHDTNGPKAAVRGLRLVGLVGDDLAAITIATDYFILRGLQETHPELHDQALEDLRTKKITQIPVGISTHNIILLSPDGSRNPDTAYVAMILNSDQHGFAAGKLSVSYEGMLDPSVDLVDSAPSTFETVKRTLREEFGIVSPSEIRLLAVCAEKQSQYTSWCHAIWVDGTPDDLLALHASAPRRRDSSVLLAVPLRKINVYTQGEIRPEIYQGDIIKGSLDSTAVLIPHPTVPWRVDALNDYIATL